MATSIIPFAGSTELPAHLAALFGEDDTNLAARSSINQLSYRGKVWRRIVDGVEEQITRTNKDTGDTEAVPIINLVVLDHNKQRSRAFYEGGFEEGRNRKPVCYSSDGVTPDDSVPEPCAKTCASCPNAVKGSLITENGKMSTKCQPNKRIVVVPTSMIGQHVPLLLRIAQTSVWDKDNSANEAQNWYAWDQYLDMLRARGARHTAAVETRVKFDTRMAYPKVLFKADRWLSPEEAQAAKQKLADCADEIAKILNGGQDPDGAAGDPGIPKEGLPASQEATGATAAAPAEDPNAKAAQAAAQAAANVAAAAKLEAEKKAQAKAAKQARADEAAKAAVAAAEAAAKAAADAGDEDEGGAWGVVSGTNGATPAATRTPARTVTPVTPVQAAAPAAELAPVVETGTPAGLSELLSAWDDNA
jgi:hypothetical protein